MKIKIFLILCMVALSPLVYSDYYPDDEYGVRSYDDAQLVRISYTLGEAYVERSYEQGYEEALVNVPIFNHDRIGTTDGRLELYLGRFNYLRMDYDTEIRFDRAPRIRTTGSAIRINRGGVYLMVNRLDFRRDIQVQTPDCGIFLMENGRYRINVHDHGGTEIQVYQGMAEVSGEHRGFNIGSGNVMTMFAGDVYRMPAMLHRHYQDDFELWNMERNRMLDRSFAYRSRYLDPEYAYYEYELSSMGRWIYDQRYRSHIWIPQNPGPAWKPYFRGRWIYHPHYGYVWNSHDSWGWYTHHYGRWHWSPNYGWYWIPGNKWSPAWVSWSWNDNYYSWCPLDLNNRPVIILQNKWMKNYRYQSGFPTNSASVIIVRKDNLWSPRIHRSALSGNRLLQINRSNINFRGRHPKLVPRTTPVSVTNAQGKTVVYKKSGFPSIEKYRSRKMEKKVNEKTVFRYSDPGKRIKTEEHRENKYRVLQKSKPEYKSFSKRTTGKTSEDTGKQDNRFRKRDDVHKSPADVRKDPTEKKGYKTLQTAQPKKKETPKKQDKKDKKKEKKEKTKKKKKDENKRNQRF